ncbi:hypothetical protein OMP38_24500 [Cohnella ginsengisoli]|uniref:Uncharacterized protein n=1 Tax=Cohnella ginsengisoli TaxID=425004 RepID=A0A9X4KP47_9BACL|nr:hypothetical protein [Cohnella ginsengisoli]MDG0793637.1 hypothetical protein [Cohnella ginsengisoli]
MDAEPFKREYDLFARRRPEKLRVRMLHDVRRRIVPGEAALPSLGAKLAGKAESRDDFAQRRLPAAVRPDDVQPLAGRQRQIDPVEYRRSIHGRIVHGILPSDGHPLYHKRQAGRESRKRINRFRHSRIPSSQTGSTVLECQLLTYIVITG